MTSVPTPSSTRISRAQGCLAGLAVGNVLGLAVESRSREAARTRLGYEGPLLRLPTEERDRDWDDDLAMAMGLSNCLTRLPVGADRLDLVAIQSTYLDWLQSGARGIGGLTREVLLKYLTGKPNAAEVVWKLRCERGPRPLGNGAAMRIAPLGVAFSDRPGLIFELACQEAAVTHWDPACRQSAGLIALLTAALSPRLGSSFAFGGLGDAPQPGFNPRSRETGDLNAAEVWHDPRVGALSVQLHALHATALSILEIGSHGIGHSEGPFLAHHPVQSELSFLGAILTPLLGPRHRLGVGKDLLPIRLAVVVGSP